MSKIPSKQLDSHAADVSVAPISGLSATQVQGALEELNVKALGVGAAMITADGVAIPGSPANPIPVRLTRSDGGVAYAVPSAANSAGESGVAGFVTTAIAANDSGPILPDLVLIGVDTGAAGNGAGIFLGAAGGLVFGTPDSAFAVRIGHVIQSGVAGVVMLNALQYADGIKRHFEDAAGNAHLTHLVDPVDPGDAVPLGFADNRYQAQTLSQSLPSGTSGNWFKICSWNIPEGTHSQYFDLVVTCVAIGTYASSVQAIRIAATSARPIDISFFAEPGARSGGSDVAFGQFVCTSSGLWGKYRAASGRGVQFGLTVLATVGNTKIELAPVNTGSATQPPGILFPSDGSLLSAYKAYSNHGPLLSLADGDARYVRGVAPVPNQTTVAVANGISTIGTAQDIGAGSAPTFARVQVTSDPQSGNDAVRSSYVDQLLTGQKSKGAVRLALTAVTASLSGLLVVDDVQTADGEVVLYAPQDVAGNPIADVNAGLWVVAAGAWTRDQRSDDWDELIGAYVVVTEGTANRGGRFTSSASGAGTVGATAYGWVRLKDPGTVVEAPTDGKAYVREAAVWVEGLKEADLLGQTIRNPRVAQAAYGAIDWDNLITPGLWGVNNTATNGPPAVEGNLQVLVFRAPGTAQVTQVAINRGNSAEPQMWQRNTIDATVAANWSPWRRYLTSGDLPIPVDQLLDPVEHPNIGTAADSTQAMINAAVDAYFAGAMPHVNNPLLIKGQRIINNGESLRDLAKQGAAFVSFFRDYLPAAERTGLPGGKYAGYISVYQNTAGHENLVIEVHLVGAGTGNTPSRYLMKCAEGAWSDWLPITQNVADNTEFDTGRRMGGAVVYGKFVSGTTGALGGTVTLAGGVSRVVSQSIQVKRSGQSQWHMLSAGMLSSTDQAAGHASPLFVAAGATGTGNLGILISTAAFAQQAYRGYLEYLK
ncbi:pyocin knob domain-containing protein [Lysobacter sp. GCM10012299]|uniref:pyocin knob domain-containing protein n=1 Tax=Lysobacter sp. GCM10012299 TaxID=3317333 RepID=UPI00362148FA